MRCSFSGSTLAVACEFFHIVSPYADTSAVHIIESGDQITYGRFATSRWTYDCSHCILRDFEADILKHLSPALSLSIGKVNISEFDIVMVNLYLSAICIKMDKMIDRSILRPLPSV